EVGGEEEAGAGGAAFDVGGPLGEVAAAAGGLEGGDGGGEVDAVVLGDAQGDAALQLGDGAGHAGRGGGPGGGGGEGREEGGGDLLDGGVVEEEAVGADVIGEVTAHQEGQLGEGAAALGLDAGEDGGLLRDDGGEGELGVVVEVDVGRGHREEVAGPGEGA